MSNDTESHERGLLFWRVGPFWVTDFLLIAGVFGAYFLVYWLNG